MTTAGVRSLRLQPAWTVNPVVVVALALAVAAILALPLVTLRPNRIVSGEGFRLWEIGGPALRLGGTALLLVIAAGIALAQQHAARAALATSAGFLLFALGGISASALLPETGFARVSLASGSWIGLASFGLLAVDALVRLRLTPLRRVAILLLVIGAGLLLIATGVASDLSIAREYAAYADVFWSAAGEHLILVAGSLIPALVIGLPLGRWCFRSAEIRGASLSILNIFQTTPSVALFALLMIPLTALAARFPALAELGVHGIGRTPALIALFLYALLPVTANTLAAFRSVDGSAMEVGRAMGMTRRQLLARVEIPLAMPLILSGIRIALVQNMGLAAIAALVGGGGFGTLIFRGMGQAAIDLVLLGALPIVVMSIAAGVIFDAVIENLRRSP